MFLKKISLLLISVFICLNASAHGLPSFKKLVKENGSSVVNISSKRNVSNQAVPQIPEDDPFYDFFRRFGPPQQDPKNYESFSRGSGFIISEDGYILTNAHVVGDSNNVNVKLSDKRDFKAKVIGYDKRTDIAIIKIDASDLPAVKVGNPDNLEVGDWVLAIGSPFGFENTVTAGIVSAKARSLPQENYVPFIQTDVAINPGNSGGPLFNLKGEVVGINAQIYSRTGGFMGLSFAIPIDLAIDIANQLRDYGKVSRGRIGVVIQEITKELAESFGLPSIEGALVNSVERNGPADQSGIEPSDVIIEFDGKKIKSVSDLPKYVAQSKPGTLVDIKIWRKDKILDLKISIGEIVDKKISSKRSEELDKKKDLSRNYVDLLGLELSNIDESRFDEFEIKGGVIVDSANGPAANAGIRSGDIILALNNRDVKNVDEFESGLEKLKKSRSIALLIKRGKGSIYVPIRLKR